MKVIELIDILQELNPEAEVIIKEQQKDEPEVLCTVDAETDEEYILIR